MKKNIRRAVILLIWMILWQLASAAIHNKIIFVGPWEMAEALVFQVQTLEFWRTILSSFVRIAGGFLLAFLTGMTAASLAGRFALLRDFLEPPVALLQSVPVASFVILALIWIGSENLSVLITFLVVFPVIYRNVLEGIGQADRGLLEMAQVFRMSLWKKLWYIYRPALMPYVLAGCRVSLGMAWKSGVAAEVIGVPDCSIGEKLYMAKIYLSTAELFAWTFVVIVVSRLFEWLFLRLLELLASDIQPEGNKKRHVRKGIYRKDGCDRYGKRYDELAGLPPAAEKAGEMLPAIQIKGLWKSYHERPVLQGWSLCLEPGDICCLMGPSGQGKTTLLRLMMGLEQADAGQILGLEKSRISVVFQEDRLCEYLDGVKNSRIAVGRAGICLDPERLHEQLLGEEAAYRPVRELSGGMKRRTAIARALAARSDVILMDEPFTGLDEETKRQTIRVIKDCLQGRTLLVVTHQEEDAKLLGAKILRLGDQ